MIDTPLHATDAIGNVERRRAKADMRRSEVFEVGVTERLVAGARFSRDAGADRYADLNIGTTVVILTVLGTGSAACRQVPVSVSCIPGRRRKPAILTKRLRNNRRWRSLNAITAAELHKRTFKSGGQNG